MLIVDAVLLKNLWTSKSNDVTLCVVVTFFVSINNPDIKKSRSYQRQDNEATQLE